MPTLGGFQLDLPDESATDRLGHAIAACLHPGDVVALDGPLGAGKTRLVRAIAIAAGVEPALIHSPTYVLANEYPLPATTPAGLTTIIHIDAYRLTEDDELAGLIDPDQATHIGAALLIEWADRLAQRGEGSPIVDHTALGVRLAHIGATARRAELSHHLAATVAERFGRTVAAAASQPAGQLPTRPCRSCGRPVSDNAEHFPFCSDRCQLVDFGKWIDGDYRISRAIKDSDLDAGE